VSLVITQVSSALDTSPLTTVDIVVHTQLSVETKSSACMTCRHTHTHTHKVSLYSTHVPINSAAIHVNHHQCTFNAVISLLSYCQLVVMQTNS